MREHLHKVNTLYTPTHVDSSIRRRNSQTQIQGFTLVVTLALMILLTVVAVGLLSLSAITLRTTSQGSAQAEARANARLALMIAIGELQKEMGPDMRISSESALLDTTPATEAIDGVAQSRWMGSHNSWGNWLNASYTSPSGGGALKIADTYTAGREKMFRRWLLSLPPGMEAQVNAPVSVSVADNPDWVDMVGKGSLGQNPKAGDVTRAFLTKVGNTGKYAWWISPENHKAKISITGQPRTLVASKWQESQGDTAEVGVGVLDGFSAFNAPSELGKKLITTNSLRLASVAIDKAEKHFFDLTASSQGVLASVRSGHLKKDLSLLFEAENGSELPVQYKHTPRSGEREPSIRPMSPDLAANSPKAKERQFASWTNMRHYYRMYRSSSDATTAEMTTSGALKWSRTKPYSEARVCLLYRDDPTQDGKWHGDNSYTRIPVLAKVTFIYSLMSERVTPGSATDLRYALSLVYTPVYTYWNPYNTELRIPDNTLGCLSSTYQVLPMRTQMFLGNVAQGTSPASLFTGNAHSFLRSGDNGEIIFKPGEIRIFSHSAIGSQNTGQLKPLDLSPGFRPSAYGGDKISMGTFLENQNPGVVVQFSHSAASGNVSYGNTPGSLCHTPFWLPPGKNRDFAFNWNFPVMYQNDWFNLAQTYTPMTPPGPSEIARWVFSDSKPMPVAYAQLVIKGLSEFDHESISWAKDWRSRNWIHSPPFYFGNSLYISEDDTTAHTQRLDNPYVMNFGPMTPSEMPKVVGHLGNNAFLGSGSDPVEQVTAVPALELPTAPLASLAGFSGMRINPGWADPRKINPDLSIQVVGGNNTSKASYAYSLAKTTAYQSGVTGPGIGNSFIHPMLPRTAIYQFFNNSVSSDPADRTKPLDSINSNDNKVFCDYWDHVFLLNDSLWDDYFVSSLADQTRPGASTALNLSANIDRLVADKGISNMRYTYRTNGRTPALIKADLQGANGYLKAASFLTVDGMFNVNSTSVAAWQSLFLGIRERQLVFRENSGAVSKINIPADKDIALSRFDTEVSDKEVDDPSTGASMPGGGTGWSGVRFLDKKQILKLAEECVKQVKQRGPFLNFAEFINRRLSNDDLGLKGALQSAIDYDDNSPDSQSINYRFKSGSDYMMTKSQLGNTSFKTPEATEGSRFAGIPGYVIQSDLLKPIANTLAVRDDTFKIRAYGETSLNGKVIARVWCEAVMQRLPDQTDSTNEADVPARLLDADGSFKDNLTLSQANVRFGRKFRIESFRWLNASEI